MSKRDIIQHFCLDFFRSQVADPEIDEVSFALWDTYATEKLPISILITIDYQQYFSEMDFHFNLFISKEAFYLKTWGLSVNKPNYVCYLYEERNGIILNEQGDLCEMEN